MPSICHTQLRTVKLAFFLLSFALLLAVLTLFTVKNPRPNRIIPIGFRYENSSNSGYESTLTRGSGQQVHEDLPHEEKTYVLINSTTECPGLTVAFPLKEPQTFQRIPNTDVFVYSAFYDNDKIRIIGIRHKFDTSTLYCQIWTANQVNEPLVVHRASLWELPESHLRSYRPMYIKCPIAQEFSYHPNLSISLSTYWCGQSTAVVPVMKSGPMTSEFVVCLAPLINAFSETHNFVESIEFKRMLGASKFSFYNHSVSEEIDKILHYYKRRGLADVYQWDLPMPLEEILSAGQIAAHNDCLMRNRFSTRYIVVQDIDEFIIPMGNNFYNWTQLVEKRLQVNPIASSFQIMHTLFKKEWVYMHPHFVANTDALRYKSTLLQHIRRESEIYRYGNRSKCIANPRKVKILGVHVILKTSEGPVDRVPAEDALLFHYRKSFPGSKKLGPQPWIFDTSVVDKYGSELVSRLKKAWASIAQETGLSFEALNTDCRYIMCDY